MLLAIYKILHAINQIIFCRMVSVNEAPELTHLLRISVLENGQPEDIVNSSVYIKYNVCRM